MSSPINETDNTAAAAEAMIPATNEDTPQLAIEKKGILGLLLADVDARIAEFDHDNQLKRESMVTVRAKLLRDLGPLESQLEDFLARMDKSERDRVLRRRQAVRTLS